MKGDEIPKFNIEETMGLYREGGVTEETLGLY